MLRTGRLGIAISTLVLTSLTGCVMHSYSDATVSGFEQLHSDAPPQALAPPAKQAPVPAPPVKKTLWAKFTKWVDDQFSEDAPPVVGERLPTDRSAQPLPLPPSAAAPERFPFEGRTAVESPFLLQSLNGQAAILPSSSLASNKLHGAWTRSFEGVKVLTTIGEKRLNVELQCTAMNEKTKVESQFTIRIGGDCAFGPDGSVFGVITDTDFEPGKTGDTSASRAESLGLSTFVGEPFAAKVRVEDGVLLLRELRCSALQGHKAVLPLVVGRYQPQAKQSSPPVKPSSKQPKPEGEPPIKSTALDNARAGLRAFLDSAAGLVGNFGFQTYSSGMTLPSPHYLNHYPQYFPADSQPPSPQQAEVIKAPTTVPQQIVLPAIPGPVEFMQLARGTLAPQSNPGVIAAGGGLVVPIIGKPVPERIPMIEEKR